MPARLKAKIKTSNTAEDSPTNITKRPQMQLTDLESLEKQVRTTIPFYGDARLKITPEGRAVAYDHTCLFHEKHRSQHSSITALDDRLLVYCHSTQEKKYFPRDPQFIQSNQSLPHKKAKMNQIHASSEEVMTDVGNDHSEESTDEEMEDDEDSEISTDDDEDSEEVQDKTTKKNKKSEDDKSAYDKKEAAKDVDMYRPLDYYGGVEACKTIIERHTGLKVKNEQMSSKEDAVFVNLGYCMNHSPSCVPKKKGGYGTWIRLTRTEIQIACYGRDKGLGCSNAPQVFSLLSLNVHGSYSIPYSCRNTLPPTMMSPKLCILFNL